VDHIGKHVARRLLRFCVVDARQVVRFTAAGPGLKAFRPGVELLWRITGLQLVIALLQPGIDKVAGDVGDRWIFAVLGEHHRRLEFSQQRDELGHAKTVVPDLDHMAQRAPLERARQQFQKLGEIGFIEFLGRRELPQHRAEAVAEFQHAGVIEPLHRIAGLRQHPPVGRKARPLQRKHKTIGHLARPFAKAFRLLRAVIGAVDFNGSQLRGGIF
jgi:hypothetical protein